LNVSSVGSLTLDVRVSCQPVTELDAYTKFVTHVETIRQPIMPQAQDALSANWNALQGYCLSSTLLAGATSGVPN
jgi:hypothetical protein